MKYRYLCHPSKLATLSVTFGAGNRVEFGRKYPYGIAHMVEHMVFKGTKNYTAKELLRKIASAGGSCNAWTSENLVSYYITIPEENIETAFECLAEITQRPKFPEEEIVKESEVIAQEIRMYDDDIDDLIYNRMHELMFSNSLSNPILGTEKSVKSITRDQLISFHKEFYKTSGMLITLGSPTSHYDLVEKYFSRSDDRLEFLKPEKNIVCKASAANTIFKEKQIQDHIAICFSGPKLREVIKQREKIKVFSVIFGSGDTSRLFMHVREDLGLVYGIGSAGSNHMDGTYYTIGTSTDPKNTKQVIKAINDEIELIKNSLPTQKELDTAKNIIKSKVYESRDTSSSLSLQSVYKEFFQYNIGDEFLQKVNSVTLKDVNEVANIIFNENKYTVIGTGVDQNKK